MDKRYNAERFANALAQANMYLDRVTGEMVPVSHSTVAQPAKRQHPTDRAIKAYMHATVLEGYFVANGVVNCTLLAEDTADHFNDFENANYDIAELYFTLAFHAAVWYSRQVESGRIKN